MTRATEGLDRRSRPVRREVEHLATMLELVLPVRKQALEKITLKSLALPQSKIGVLNRQPLQRRRLSGKKRAIELSKFSEQNTFGPTVKDNMVEREKQNVIVLVKPQETPA